MTYMHGPPVSFWASLQALQGLHLHIFLFQLTHIIIGTSLDTLDTLQINKNA